MKAIASHGARAARRCCRSLPTAVEQGLAGVEADGWNAFFFPKGTPEPIVRRLNAATSEALDNPAIRKRMEELGLIVPPAERRTPGVSRQVGARGDRRNGRPRSRRAGVSAD